MTVTFEQTVGALYGDLIDVDVLSAIAKLDDPSSAHVPGVLKIARRRKPVAKGMGELKDGILASLRRQSGVHASYAGSPANGLRMVGEAGAKPANKNLPKASTTDKVRSARAGAERLLGTTEGKVAAGVAGGGVLYGAHERKKANNASSSYAVYKLDDRAKRKLTAGASAVGAAAGVIGTAAGIGAVRGHIRDAPLVLKPRQRVMTGLRNTKKLERGLLAVEPVGLAGEVGATTILHGDTKKQPVDKAGTFEIAGSFSKFDSDKQRAYGWASVVELDGLPVIDRQGDVIDLDDLEEAAYVYVRKSRVTGDMHRRTHDDLPHRVGELIESVVFTPDKCEAMGVSKSLAGKWWMGVQVEDPDAWQLVKKGERTGFSIHGKGLRKATTVDDVMYGR